MNEQEIKEGNKLIAVFMGATLRTFEHTMSGDTVFAEFPVAPNLFNSNLGSMSIDHLFYHKSWDWLMPVIYKANECVLGANRVCDWQDTLCTLFQEIGYSLELINPIESIYSDVVKFIQHFNTRAHE